MVKGQYGAAPVVVLSHFLFRICIRRDFFSSFSLESQVYHKVYLSYNFGSSYPPFHIGCSICDTKQ